MPDRVDPARPAPLQLPPSTPEPSKPGFPWIASLAPIGGAVAVWAITGSAFALLFAALGPLVAIATMLDARRHGARSRRRALAERGRAIERLRSEVADRHDLERDAAWRRTPSAREASRRAVPTWRRPAPGDIVVGTGTTTSGLRVDGVATDERDARLLDEASVLRGAPIRVDAADGIGFVGVAHLARAAARAVVVQCADAVSPELLVVESTGGAWEWLASMPHHANGSAGSRLVVHERRSGPRSGGSATDGAGPASGEASMLAVADHAGALPPGLGAVVHLASPRAGVLTCSGRPPLDIVPELLSSAEAADWADRAARAARRAGLAARGGVIPERVSLRDLPEPPTHARRGRDGLRVGVGVGVDGPFELDLAAGPHALVAGTSGSGKSEFLLAWLTALALAYAPDRVAFLLVDFKGGAAFEPIAGLPHVTGVVTDLDEHEAARAVASIRAELRRREHILRSAGARDLAGLDDRVELPRLVVVVDEFQAMVERFPDLGEVVADVAARGRSLGVHLVLASQRPNGVVRDQVTANCGIRISLRVLQRSDSLAVVGTDAAALIEAGRPGRAVADPGDGRAVRFQSALADVEAVDRALRRHADARPPRRPWLDPLPRSVTLETIGAVLAHGRPAATSAAVAAGDEPGRAPILLGVVDDPDRQRRLPAEWRPLDDGPLVVLGVPGSGRSALLNAVAAQVEARSGLAAVARIEGPRGRAWDAVHRIADSIGAGGAPALVVVDDVDLVFAAWPDDYRFAAFARLEELLRNARGAGIAVAASAVRLAGLTAGLRDAFTASALLRHASRAELVHAGGAGAAWSGDAPRGAGQWRGRGAQFLAAGRPARPHDDGPEALDLAGHPVVAVAVAAAAAGAAAATLTAHAPHAEVIRLGGTAASIANAAAALEGPVGDGRQRIVVGDAEAWASNWSLASAARARATAVVHGGHAEYRSLARGTALPPLLDEPARECWIVPLGQPTGRRGWPPPKTTESARGGP